MAKVEGVQQVINNLVKAKIRIGDGLDIGLVKAGLRLQRESQRIVPVDTGALRGSAFTRKEGRGQKAKVSVGYTAEYAIYVHENLDARHAPGKMAKFLEKPARELRDTLARIVQREIDRKA